MGTRFIKRKLHPNKDVCESCKFFDLSVLAWEGHDGEVHEACGYCKASSPSRSKEGYGIWPLVNGNDWCGTFVPR